MEIFSEFLTPSRSRGHFYKIRLMSKTVPFMQNFSLLVGHTFFEAQWNILSHEICYKNKKSIVLRTSSEDEAFIISNKKWFLKKTVFQKSLSMKKCIEYKQECHSSKFKKLFYRVCFSSREIKHHFLKVDVERILQFRSLFDFSASTF